MQQADIAKLYPPKALHPELFAPSSVDEWFVPEMRQALAKWQQTGDRRDIDVAAIPGLRLEAPGVVSFDCLHPSVCDKLLAEAKHYSDSGLPQRAPNSMNNYGVVLTEIGLRPSFDAMLKRYTAGLGALFFGEDDVRPNLIDGEWRTPSRLRLCPFFAAWPVSLSVKSKADVRAILVFRASAAKPAELENWGGDTLNDHHTFIVRYRPDEDRHLDMHVDECDVTFNFGLCDNSDFTGSELAFCGMYGSVNHRKHLHTYSHVKGRCVLHSGKRRHGALNVETGLRASLIMWTKSTVFRRTAAYKKRWGNAATVEAETDVPDRICLSYTHDRDFFSLRRKLGDAVGVVPPGED